MGGQEVPSCCDSRNGGATPYLEFSRPTQLILTPCSQLGSDVIRNRPSKYLCEILQSVILEHVLISADIYITRRSIPAISSVSGPFDKFDITNKSISIELC